MMNTHIFLYGPPGSGKSTLGRGLAESLGLPFTDLDQLIAAQAERTIPEIFAAEGESGFRAREAEALRRAVATPTGVIALGGGALLAATNRELAQQHGRILLLEADLATLAGRTALAPGARPLLDGAREGRPANDDATGALAALLERRASHYASFPERMHVTDEPPETHLLQAQALLGRYRVSGMGQPYDVHVGRDLLQDLGTHLVARHGPGRVLVVGDTHTEPRFGGPVAAALASAGFRVTRTAIAAGEAHKQITTVTAIWQACLAAGLDRGDTIVAVGGGVTGDLAGFAAATWLRGVRWVGVPTTLLAMVDSSLGGKTGADLPEGKNLIGAFHPPALVLADTTTLASLPDDEFRAGMAEVVKHGIIADPELFEHCRGSLSALRRALQPGFVSRAMAVKIRTIAQDPFETGVRAALNLGHTIGHGIEQAMSFGLRHGEAVSIGIVCEARIAEQLGLAQPGLADTVAGVLSGLGLPTAVPPGLDRTACLAAIRLDKKRQAGKVRFALPVRVGEIRVGVLVDEACVADAIR
jgi:3-dehydroquinate synthase